MANSDAQDRVDLIKERAIKMRSLEIDSSDEGTERRLWLVGRREPMRAGLQQVLEGSLGIAHRWLIHWVQGRWPRGPLTLCVPLSGQVEGISLGLIAPLSPTRIALSEGPLPFAAASVKHFKALHGATGAQGLSGCRLGFGPHQVSHVALRWDVEEGGLRETMAQAELSEVFDEEILPIVSGLREGLGLKGLSLEAAYTPEPPQSFAIELGPVPSGRVIGLSSALWGEDAKHCVTEAARMLSQRWTHRIRLEFDASGLKRTKALLTTYDVSKADW